MRFILKVDKEDCFKVAELKEITAVELLIINKALHLLSQNEEVAESDRYVAEKLGAELMRMDAVQRPLTAIDGADIADTPQTGYEKGLQEFADLLFDKNKQEQFLKECKAMGIEP